MSKEQSGSQVAEKDKLVGALDTIAQIVLGKELATIQRTVAEQDTNLGRRVDGVREELTRSDEQIQKDLRSRDRDLEARHASLREEIDNLSRELATVQFELQQQIDSMHQMASVMGNLANVFSAVPANAPALHAAGGPSSSSPSKEDMENALDDLFEKKG